jgi:hypothetical protein
MKTLRKYSLLFIVLGGMNCGAVEDEYYRALLSAADTNKFSNGIAIGSSSRADLTNTGVKLTNTAVRVDQFKAVGEVGDIRLGMTMGEVVARLGKPQHLSCGRFWGTQLYYYNAELFFEGNVLCLIASDGHLPFDHGLEGRSERSRVDDWIRVLGEPKERIESKHHSVAPDGKDYPYTRTKLVYENSVATSRLYFGRDGHSLEGVRLCFSGSRFAKEFLSDDELSSTNSSVVFRRRISN